MVVQRLVSWSRCRGEPWATLPLSSWHWLHQKYLFHHDVEWKNAIKTTKKPNDEQNIMKIALEIVDEQQMNFGRQKI